MCMPKRAANRFHRADIKLWQAQGRRGLVKDAVPQRLEALSEMSASTVDVILHSKLGLKLPKILQMPGQIQDITNASGT